MQRTTRPWRQWQAGLCAGVLLAVAFTPWQGARASATDAVPPSCRATSVTRAVSMADAARAIACASRAHALLLVGDIHGTRQIPAFVVQLVREVSVRRPVRLGLEMPDFMQRRLAAYMHSDGSAVDRAALLKSAFWRLDDGRESRAMLGLVEQMRRMRAHGRDVQVFAMAPTPASAAQVKQAGGYLVFKEGGIARRLRARLAHADKTTLVIAYMGNWHTRYQSTFAGMGAKHMGPSVTDRLADSHPVLVDPTGYGKAWVCMQGGCGVHAIGRASQLRHKPRLWTTPDPTGRVVHLHLRLPPFTASLPAVANRGQPSARAGHAGA